MPTYTQADMLIRKRRKGRRDRNRERQRQRQTIMNFFNLPQLLWTHFSFNQDEKTGRQEEEPGSCRLSGSGN